MMYCISFQLNCSSHLEQFSYHHWNSTVLRHLSTTPEDSSVLTTTPPLTNCYHPRLLFELVSTWHTTNADYLLTYLLIYLLTYLLTY